jgi:hypothetical protein
MTETLANVSAVSTLLGRLSCSRFLQPLKWDQLPHPDLDIDLNPSSLGDEPLSADQWVDLSTRAAETAAANMFLALDQEDEMEWYIEQMVKERCLGGTIRPPLPQARELLESPDQGENIEQLIDLEDESRPPSPSRTTEDTKDDDRQGQEHRLEDVQPSSTPIPELEGQISLLGTARNMPALFRSDDRSHQYGFQDHSILASSDICPASALNSATIAKVAASAAEADATIAHYLLYGRRGRRECVQIAHNEIRFGQLTSERGTHRLSNMNPRFGEHNVCSTLLCLKPPTHLLSTDPPTMHTSLSSLACLAMLLSTITVGAAPEIDEG